MSGKGDKSGYLIIQLITRTRKWILGTSKEHHGGIWVAVFNGALQQLSSRRNRELDKNFKYHKETRFVKICGWMEQKCTNVCIFIKWLI